MTNLANSSKPIHFANTQADLDAALPALKAAPSLAFDLEFDSNRHAYGLTFCLIQIATPDGVCYVIDPLAKNMDLSGIYAILEDERVLKLVHCPGEDLRLLDTVACHPRNMLDTEVIAKLLNIEQTSLAALLESRLGIAVNKGQQKSNWTARPLSSEQITYAAADVAWLHGLRDDLVNEAEIKGLSALVAGEYAALSVYRHEAGPRDSFLKPADVRTLSPYDQHILESIYQYREAVAKAWNKPAYQIASDELVRALASGDTVPADFATMKGIHHRLKRSETIHEWEDKLDDILDKAESLSRTPDKRPRLSPEAHAEQRELRARGDRDRSLKFGPVQAALRERYGEFAGRYLLSNGLVQEITEGRARLSTLNRPYRRDLILGIAGELGIGLDDYL